MLLKNNKISPFSLNLVWHLLFSQGGVFFVYDAAIGVRRLNAAIFAVTSQGTQNGNAHLDFGRFSFPFQSF